MKLQPSWGLVVALGMMGGGLLLLGAAVRPFARDFAAESQVKRYTQEDIDRDIREMRRWRAEAEAGSH